jgi:arginase
MGPSAIRYAGLSDRLERAGIEVEDRGNVAAALAETQASGSERARFLEVILETCGRVAQQVEQARGDGLLPLLSEGTTRSPSVRSAASQSPAPAESCGWTRTAT